MSESRRELFRTSILSAIGGVIAGALGGFAIGRETESFAGGPTGKGGGPPRPFVSPLAGSVVAVYGQDQQMWYFFQFSPSDPSQCQLLYLPKGTPFPGTAPSATNPIDTYTWYTTLGAKPTPTTSTITINYANGGSGGSIKASFSGGPYLDGDGLRSLLHALVDMQQLTAGSWNEIGHN